MSHSDVGYIYHFNRHAMHSIDSTIDLELSIVWRHFKNISESNAVATTLIGGRSALQEMCLLYIIFI